jgi:Cu(I)/Ag(I) efflux system membrane fusion protein
MKSFDMNKKNLTYLALAAAVGVLGGLLIAKNSTPQQTPAAEAATPATANATAFDASHTMGEKLIQAQPVEMQKVLDRLVLNGKLAINGLNLHQVSARVAGRIDRITLLEGAYIQAGQPIAWLFSPEFISAQNEYLLARRSVKALNTSATQDLLEDAKATLEGARNKLRILGASESDIALLDSKGVAQEYLAISSLISGRVTKRSIDPGGYLNTGDSVGAVADMSTLWFLGNAFEVNLSKLHEGQEVNVFVPAADANGSFKGRISFVAPIVDPNTHTVAVRVDIPNGKGILKPEMFAKAEIDLGARELPVVPRSAVVQDGAESFVLVQRDDKTYQRVSVVVTPANDAEHLAIVSGVNAGDKVVFEGSVLVDRELINTARIDQANAAASSASQVKP